MCDGQSGTVTRGDTGEAQENTAVVLTGARHRRHATPRRATGESTRVVRREERQQPRESQGHSFYQSSFGKGRQGTVNS